MKTFSQKKMVRKMNFISDQAGIMNRYLREKEHWDSHLENTKHFILDSFKDVKINTIAVLGSGWLLDLPLKKLTEKYKKILLVDVYHPPQIRKKAESYKNVTLFETDLSGGGMEYCWELRKQKGEHFSKYILQDFEPVKPAFPAKPDAYISLNLLNQLDILLIDFLKKKNHRITDNEFQEFRKSIQEFHLEWITKKPGCLITDILEMNTGLEKKSKTVDLVHVKLPKSKRKEEWTWDFDLSEKYHENMKTRMKVNAVEW